MPGPEGDRAHDAPTAALADLVRSVDGAALGHDARRMVGGAILGVLGTGIAGTQGDEAAPLIRHAAGAGNGQGALVWGTLVRTWTPVAALANGMAAHLFDWDDTSESAQAHLTVAMLPALLALGETTGASGRQLLDAYVAGFELAAVIGRAVNPAMVERGWHATGVLGTFAATAACCRLLGLGQAATGHALGIAASTASGVMANLGTPTKALHAGLAARNGIDAAMLAGHGFAASPDVFAAKPDPLATFAGAGVECLRQALAERNGRLDIAAVGLILKAYPCCASAHRSVQATLELARTHELARDAVERIDCRVSALAFHKLHHTPPGSPLEAKLHIPFCIAAAVEDGGLFETSFTERRLRDPAFRARMEHVTVAIHPDLAGQVPPAAEFSEVTMTLRDGRVLDYRVQRPRGTPQQPLDDAFLQQKFRACAEGVLGPQRTADCIDAVRSLEQLPRVSDLTRLLEPAA